MQIFNHVAAESCSGLWISNVVEDDKLEARGKHIAALGATVGEAYVQWGTHYGAKKARGHGSAPIGKMG